MTAAADDEEIALRADKLYAARAALAETEAGPRRLGVAELVQFLSDPGRSLSMDEQRMLFADPRLRADYRRLKAQLSVAELPALAAASAGDVDARRFDGGTVRIHASRVAGQVYVVLQVNSAANPPRAILLEGAGGELVKRVLPPCNAAGEIMIVLDRANAPDQAFLRLLAEPTTTGLFLS